MTKKKVSEREVEEEPKISEEYYKILDKKIYLHKPKERFKSIMLVEEKSSKKSLLDLLING